MPDEPSKIAYLLPCPHFFGQTEGVGGHIAHALGMVAGFMAEGHAVQVISEDAPGPPGWLPGVIAIEISSEGLAWPLMRWPGRFLQGVRAGHQSFRPDLYYVRYAARFSPWLAKLKQVAGDVPLVLEVNSIASQLIPATRWLDARFLRHADVLLCVSEQVAQHVAAVGGARLAEKVIVLPNAVDPERFVPASTAPADGDHPWRIGYSGVLKPDYGLEVLLTAFSRVREQIPHAELRVIGGGPHAAELRRLGADQPGLSFIGPKRFEEIPRELIEVDVLVHTTSPRFLFQSPIKLFEYMAAGKPLVAADSPPVRNVWDEQNPPGLLYPVGDADGLSSALIELAKDSSRGLRMGQRGRQLVEQQHTWQKRVATLFELPALQQLRASEQADQPSDGSTA